MHRIVDCSIPKLGTGTVSAVFGLLMCIPLSLLAGGTTAQTIRIVEAGISSAQTDDFSFNLTLSANGQIVAFRSRASNLVDADTNQQDDIFIYDRQTNETRRVSIASDGAQANGDSRTPALSANGQIVVFSSAASDLVANDSNAREDIFMHNLQSGETRRISVASNGTQANSDSFNPTLSADGRIVAFSSEASNLVAGDSNRRYDIFVHDLQTGETKRVSVASDGTQGNSDSYNPTLSGNGQVVAFSSEADNLVAGDSNGQFDIFVHGQRTGITRRASVASDGAQGNSTSFNPALSNDGQTVAFRSLANNLVADDSNNRYDIFVHELPPGQTSRVSVASDGTQADSLSFNPTLSADGRIVVFSSRASNLVAADSNASEDVFVHDRQTSETTRVSLASDGTQANDDSRFPTLSADGQTVAFSSAANNLINGDTNDQIDIFVHQRRMQNQPPIILFDNGFE